MRKAIYITSYLIALVTIFGYLVLLNQSVRRPSYGVDPGYMVEIKHDKIIPYTRSEYSNDRNSDEDFSGISFIALPRVSRGPLREGFTFYYTSSYLSEISDVSIQDYGEHTDQEIQMAFEAVQKYAQTIPLYESFRPGQPPRTVVDRQQAIQCGVGLLATLILPGLVAYLICWIFRVNKRASFAYRRQHGMCVKCGYSVKGIQSHICPECGQLHGSSTEAIA